MIIIQHVKIIVLEVCVLISVLEFVSDVLETQFDDDYKREVLNKQVDRKFKHSKGFFSSEVYVDCYKLNARLQNESTENIAFV
jgi:hypothetical protein